MISDASDMRLKARLILLLTLVIQLAALAARATMAFAPPDREQMLKEELPLAKFIVDSGLADAWRAKDQFKTVLSSGCGRSPEAADQ